MQPPSPIYSLNTYIMPPPSHSMCSIPPPAVYYTLHLGFIRLRCNCAARVCAETNVFITSLSAAGASYRLPMCRFALRTYGSVFSVSRHCGRVCVLYAFRTGLAAPYPVDGTPFAVRICQCTMFIPSVCLALRSLHISPPHCLLLPMHPLPAYLRFGVWRDTHSIPCAKPIAATYYGGC